MTATEYDSDGARLRMRMVAEHEHNIFEYDSDRTRRGPALSTKPPPPELDDEEAIDSDTAQRLCRFIQRQSTPGLSLDHGRP